MQLRGALLDFIADFANWDNATAFEFLTTSRRLTQAAHEALGGTPGTRPLVVDPFAGGGSIPLEALRLGADAFASDLNPIAVLLNKVVLEYIPKYGQSLANEVRKSGEWIQKEAEKELAEFYPKDSDGATPIAYLWARTIQCEGPGCGAELPLMRSLWLAKKANGSVALRLVPRPRTKRVDFQIIVKQRGGWVNQADQKENIPSPKFDGTVKRGSATCPCCGYTTAVASVRNQMRKCRGGAANARLLAVVSTRTNEQGRFYRLPTDRDHQAIQGAHRQLERLRTSHTEKLSLVPDEEFPPTGLRRIQVPNYGITTIGDLFSPRQALAISTMSQLIEEVRGRGEDPELCRTARLVLCLLMDKQIDLGNSLNRWEPVAQCPRQLFARQSVPIVWDFAEGVPIGESSGSWTVLLNTAVKILSTHAGQWHAGVVEQVSALHHPLPDDSATLLFTDPPYYDSVVYAHTADVFYPWLRRRLSRDFPTMFEAALCPKDEEIVVDPPHSKSPSKKDATFFEQTMTTALAEARRITKPSAVGVVVFAHQSTAGWEAMLSAMLDAAWMVTGSWPIDTEMASRVIAQGRAVLASSVHLVCRPRENPDGSIRTDEIGDWRDVLSELPRRIHDWMPRLAEEGVVGADAIFACLGPALEIFSRYSRVEKASGEVVTLKEYLEQVWAAVAKEALTMIFTGADATGFEEDARLTAMWLWTLQTGDANGTESSDNEEVGDDEEGRTKKGKASGFVLEYDASRKIAQGLGAHLENLSSVVEILGETARLLPVVERAAHLFGKDEGKATPARKKKKPQLDLFKGLQVAEETGPMFGETEVSRVGDTVLDRIHQSMILFAGGRGEALRRFLVEDGAGTDQRFWRLAQALSALYPSNTDEKRWVDGVLARKKGLGL